MAENDNIPELPEHESETIWEEALGGKPLAHTPEKGVELMKQRIEDLTKEVAATDNIEIIRRLRADIQKARQRLAEYEVQLKGRN